MVFKRGQDLKYSDEKLKKLLDKISLKKIKEIKRQSKSSGGRIGFSEGSKRPPGGWKP
jgi:hypothetical protein